MCSMHDAVLTHLLDASHVDHQLCTYAADGSRHGPLCRREANTPDAPPIGAVPAEGHAGCIHERDVRHCHFICITDSRTAQQHEQVSVGTQDTWSCIYYGALSALSIWTSGRSLTLACAPQANVGRTAGG